MPTVSWKLPPPSHGDNSTTSADNWKVPPLTRGDSSMEKTPTDWKVRSEFDDSDDNPFDDNNSFDDDNSLVHDDDLTTQADNWKVSPSALGDSSTKKTPTDWKVRSAFDDDDDNSTTPANNWKVPPLTLGDSSTKKIPTDWKVRSTFDDDDDNSTIPANNWKVPSSTLGDSSTKKTPTDWKVRSTFDDDDDDSTTPAGNWKIPPSTLGDTKKTPTDWKNRSSFNGYSKKATTTDSWKLPPLIEDDGSSRTTSADNPEVFPSVHDNDSMETMPTYTPYLQLPHLLSLAWITYPVISLILVAFRLQLSLASAENGLDNLKNDILASCTAAEKASTAAASMPRYLAQTSNQQFADAANGVMSDAQSALILSLTILEGTLNFVIDMYRSTFLCLLELVVGVGLSLVTDAVQVLATSVASIGSDLASEISSANTALTSVINDINRVDPLHKISAPSISASDLSSLQNLTLPPTFQSTLTSINNSMPTADQIKGGIDDLVDTPFTLLKQLINSTFDNLTFDATLFPVPAENQLSFCNNLDTSSIDSFKTDLTNVAKYGTYIIIGFAGVLIGLNCLLIWYRWRSMKKHLERTRGAWVSDPVLNPNGFSESSPSAPQVTHSDRNLMMSQASAPQGNLSDRNLMMPQAAFPSAPQVPLSDRNLMMSQAASPSTPQGNLSGHNLMMSQASVPQGNLSGHNLMMSQASAPQGNLSDHNLMMPQASAPQGNLNDHNLMMSQATSPSAPQVTLSNHNMMMLQADSEHPVITRIMYFLAARTGMTPSQNIDMRWFFHYIFHPPALACFLIGFFGLLSVMIQLLLLGPLLSAARTEIDVAVSELSGIIVNAINTTMYNQSATYANDINSKVDVVQNTINHGLFGWVNGTTTLLNNSINSFYTDVQDFISNLFNGTVLEDPALDFLQCIIGNKVADIEDALTFLSDNLVINIPRVSQDVLVLSAPTVNEVTSPIASAAAGSGSSGGDQGLLGDVVSLYEDSLKSEAVLFGIFMGLWGIVVLTAICILLWRVHKRNKAAAAAAAKRQRVNPEVQVELKHMEGSEFSFSNDEKNDPVIY